MSLNFPKTILIVCEGQENEPSYFRKIRDILISKDLDIVIDIRPRPIVKPKKKRFKARPGGRLREIQNADVLVPVCEIEEKYRAQPTRYVREAQIGLEEEIYDEVWAVFDKDGHARHQEAFELSEVLINQKKVNIGFNSISFEQWILLHFEYNTTPFQRSMCRTVISKDNKEYHFCGTTIHHSDCQGINCVCGRIVERSYLGYENSKKSFLFDDYFPNTNTAIINAIALRNSYSGTITPIYNLNPYTNIDRLVYKLLHLDSYDFNWFTFDIEQEHKRTRFSLTKNAQILTVNLINDSNLRQIYPVDTFVLFNINADIVSCGTRTMINPDDQADFTIDLLSFTQFQPVYIGFKINDEQFLVSELPI